MIRSDLLRCLFGLGIICLLWQGSMMNYGDEESVLVGKRIAIDVGHGGIDSGAQYYGLSEKDINLKIALQLGEKLTRVGAEVIYTREDDVDYYTRGKGGKRADLLKRVAMIEEAHADVFISIHCNASQTQTYHGAQVFYHAKRAENRRLAELMQGELASLDHTNRRQAAENHHVLLLSSLSAVGVLVEAGYLSNEAEAMLLASEVYRDRLSDAILQSLFRYFAEKNA